MVAAIMALAAPIWLHLPVPRAAVFAVVSGVGGLSVILLLLATTPRDAIRLPRWASVAGIGAGAAALQALGGAPAWAVLSAGVAGLVLSASTSSQGAKLGPNFPWALTLLLWHPSLWFMSRLASIEPSSAPSSPLLWFGPMFAGGTVVTIAAFALGTSERRESRFLMMSWVFAAVLTVMPAWRLG